MASSIAKGGEVKDELAVTTRIVEAKVVELLDSLIVPCLLVGRLGNI